MRRIALGDEVAFDRLYRLTSPRLHALARLITRNPDHAEEALQDLFATVWFRAVTYRPDAGAVFSWMLTILRHRIIGLNRGKKLPLVPLDQAEAVVSDAMSPYDSAALSEAGRRVSSQLGALSPNIRLSVQLAFFHGADYREIAAHIGVPTNTAKSWVRRGMHRLQRALEP